MVWQVFLALLQVIGGLTSLLAGLARLATMLA
jgi:hypothetical protein